MNVFGKIRQMELISNKATEREKERERGKLPSECVWEIETSEINLKSQIS